MKYSRTTKSDTWWFKSGKGKQARYLVDNTVDQIDNIISNSDKLGLSGGAWSDVSYRAGWGGTVLYSGNNVIAFLDGFNPSRLSELDLI